VRKIFEKACKVLGKNPAGYNADVHFVTADEIRALNLKWRGINKITDVLSFPLLDKNPATGKIELGDIVICRECAGEFSENFLYLHGLLHLFGFTHDNDKDEDAMNAVAAEVLGNE
jgi:rRNA maturation RNase YbeY